MTYNEALQQIRGNNQEVKPMGSDNFSTAYEEALNKVRGIDNSQQGQTLTYDNIDKILTTGSDAYANSDTNFNTDDSNQVDMQLQQGQTQAPQKEEDINAELSDEELANKYADAMYKNELDKIQSMPDGNEKQVKLLEIEKKKREMKQKTADINKRADRTKKIGSIQITKALDPIMALGRISEDIANLVRGAVGAEKSTIINDYWDSKQEEIKKIEKDLGYKEGDIITPSNIAEVTANLVYTAMPFLKIAGTLGKVGAIEGIVAGGQEYGKSGNAKEAIKQGAIAGAGTVVGAKTLGYVGNKLMARLSKEPTSKLHTRLKELINMSKVNEDEIYNNYAKVHNVDVKDLTVNDKITAIAYANPEAESFLDASLSRVEARDVLSAFHNYAKSIGSDLKNKIDSEDIAGIQKLVNGVSDSLSQGYKDFTKILDNSYGDIHIPLPRDRKTINVMRDVVSKIGDSNTRRSILKMFQKQQVGLADLHRIKVLIGERLGKLYSPIMTPSDKEAYDTTRVIYKNVDELLHNSLPDDMKGMYGELKSLYRTKVQADKKTLFSRFKTEGANIEQKHLDTIAKEMNAPQKGSSYDSFISLMGKDSTESNKVEGALIESILKSNTDAGFVDFVKTFKNIDNLHFKTPQGKALKDIIKLYSKVFRNVGNKKNGISIPSEQSGLTLNPLVSEAYKAKTGFMRKLGESLGFTNSQKAGYILKNLPKVIETKKIPSSFTLKEQRGAISFAKTIEELARLGNQTSEELEAGGIGKYFETSQMIGSKGAKNLPDIISEGEAYKALDKDMLDKDMHQAIKKGWEKTKWYFDDMDGKWKFHLNGKDVKLKLSKGAMTKTGIYKVKDLISMPDLFKAYPELAEREIKLSSFSANNLGGYNPHSGNIVLNSNFNWGKNGNPMKTVKETIVHELQHAIQGIEEFATGSSSNGKTFNQYASSHGEVEARALTRGNVGEYPKNIYDKEYSTGDLAYRGSTPKPLTKDVTNFRGTRPYSDKPEEVIHKGKRFRP